MERRRFNRRRFNRRRLNIGTTGGVTATALVALLTAAASSAGINYTPAGEIAQQSAEAQVAESQAEAGPRGTASLSHTVLSADLTQMRWGRSFGGERPDVFNDVVVRRTDFAVISAGSTMSRSAGRKDAWVVAVDSDGEVLWERSIGGALDEEVHAIIDLENGDLVIAGAASTGATGGGAGFIHRLDSGGNDVWSYRYDGDAPDLFSALTALPNGDLLAAGNAGSMETVLARLTPEGELVWAQTYRENMPQSVHAILPAANGDLFLIGESTALFDSDGAIARVSSAGASIWFHSVGGEGNDALRDAVMLRDGHLIAVGKQEKDGGDDGWIVRFSSSGETVWEKSVSAGGSDSFSGVTLRADQTLVVVGAQAANDFSADNAWLVEFADDGSISRAQSYGGVHNEGFASVTSRSDGSVVTAGFRQFWHGEALNAYSATIGSPMERVAMRSASSAVNPPVVFVPGEGKLLTDRSSVEVLGNVIHEKPIAQLFVDGRPTKVLQNGAFTARVAIPLGTTRVRVEALDGEGAVGAAEIMVTRVEEGSIGVANLTAIKDQVQFGNYHAVVIGNNQYGGDLRNLETAEHDARAVAQTLESQFGFNVDLLINAGHDEIVTTLEQKSASLREDDNLLVYYAGHGWYDEDVDLGYWLPVDASLETKHNWIRNSTITDSIKSMKAKHVMLVADSCFSGTLLRSVDVKRSGRFYERMASRSARLVMTSGGVEPVMDGGGDGHSLFARSFLDKLQAGEEIIDGTSLFQAIREPVILGSEQVPQYSNIRFIDSDGGDFLFVRQGGD